MRKHTQRGPYVRSLYDLVHNHFGCILIFVTFKGATYIIMGMAGVQNFIPWHSWALGSTLHKKPETM